MNHDPETASTAIARASAPAAIQNPHKESEEEKRRQYEDLKTRMTRAS